MTYLLRCPEVSIELFNKYISISNDERKYSNFGFCETELRKRFSKILKFPLNQLCLGSSATSLLEISCNLFSEEIKKKKGKIYFPAFSFFSTFSIAYSLKNEIIFFDINKDSFLPDIKSKITNKDLIYLNVPFGSSKKLKSIINYAREKECRVIIDAAACLPGIIYKNIEFNDFPKNVIIIFSLHATKLISCGEGGLCLFGSSIPNYIKKLTNFGISEGRKQKWVNSTNAKMSEFNSAAGLASLDTAKINIEKVINAKKKVSKISKKYGLRLFDDEAEATLTVNLINNSKSNLTDNLSKHKYEFRRWWAIAENIDMGKYSNSFELFETIIGIPFDWENIDSYFEQMCKRII